MINNKNRFKNRIFKCNEYKWVVLETQASRLHETVERYVVIVGETPAFLQKTHL
jgi:hypothetical protein